MTNSKIDKEVISDKEAQDHLEKLYKALKKKNNTIWVLIMLLLLAVSVIVLKFLNFL